MTRWLLSAILAGTVCAQIAGPQDAGPRKIEGELAAVLKWQILWRAAPAGFRVPRDEPVSMALHLRPHYLSYCSHQLGVCERFMIGTSRNWRGVANATRGGSESDEVAVLRFDGQDNLAAQKSSPPESIAMGPGGVSGSFSPTAGILWVARMSLATRAEIIREYR